MANINSKPVNNSFHFLQAGGEMGSLIRSTDWSNSPLGDPETWPISLRTMVSVMLENPFGMYIAWGPEYTQLYNDGFRPILGTTKHPQALGISSTETFSEIWDTIGPMFADVMKGHPIGFPDFEVNLNRHGYTETCYFDFSYSPIRLENGDVGGILVTVIETTNKKKAETDLVESKQKLEFAIEAARIGTWEYNPITNTFSANDRLKEWFGLPLQDDINLEKVVDVITPTDRLRIQETIKEALDFSHGGHYQVQYTIVQPGTGKEIIVRAKGKAWFTKDKIAYRLNGTLEDVTEEVLSQKKIKENEVFNRTILESSPDCIKVLDLDGNITFINTNGVSILEADNREYFTGKNWISMWNDETRPLAQQSIEKALLGHDSHFEARSFTFKKRQKWWDILVRPIIDNQGDIISVLVTSRDITDRKKAHELLKESEERFRTLADNMSQLAWIADEHGNRYWYNQRWYDYTGTTVEEMKGEAWRKIHHPNRVENVAKKLQHSWDTGEIWEDTVLLRSRDGDYRWFLLRAVPIKDENGTIIHWFGTNTDITEQKDLIEKLNSTVDKLRLYERVVENTNDGVLITSAGPIEHPGPEILYANNAFYQQTGYTENEVIGKTTRLFQGPATEKNELDKMRLALQNCSPVKVEAVNYNKQGEELIVQKEIIPLMDDNNQVKHFVSIQKDVTDQVNTHKKIKESEERFRSLANKAPMWVWMADNKLNVTYANDELLDYIGIESVEAFTGKTWEKVVHPDDIQKVYKVFGKAVYNKKDFSIECSILNALTKEYEFHFIKAAPRYHGDKFDGFIGTGINIQEQKSTLNLLEYRQALLEAFNESSHDGILLVDTTGKILSYNHRFLEIWNMPQEVVDTRDDKAALEHAMHQLKDPREFMERINWLYAHPKEVSVDELHFSNNKIVERHGYPVIASDGRFFAWSWTFRDITEIRRATYALRESEETFRQLSELMPEKVSRTDAKGNAIYFNQSWLDYTGLEFDQIKDWNWQKTVHPDDLDALVHHWKHSLSTGENFEMEFRLLNKEGEYKWHLCRSTALKDENGIIKNWLAAATEIQKIKEEEQRKGDFIKMVSHELKTPVTSIKGYIQLLLSMITAENEKSIAGIPLHGTLQRVDSQILRLTRLITEMLDLSRLEENKLELKNETFDLAEMVEETTQDVIHTNSTHAIHLAKNTNAIVAGDRDRVQQVLINFINNAIKYSPGKNKIDVIISNVPDNKIAVSVKDHGIGISKKDYNNIFERFYRVSGKNEKSISGFGIGLFIAKEIIERHHGNISVESTVGKGSIFTFILPIKKYVEQTQKA